MSAGWLLNLTNRQSGQRGPGIVHIFTFVFVAYFWPKINIFILTSAFVLFKGPPLINQGVTNSFQSYIFATESPLAGVAE